MTAEFLVRHAIAQYLEENPDIDALRLKDPQVAMCWTITIQLVQFTDERLSGRLSASERRVLALAVFERMFGAARQRAGVERIRQLAVSEAELRELSPIELERRIMWPLQVEPVDTHDTNV